ncbi:hypothetical protein K7X08_011666 [Anisodus acutangulus]|uniref:Protein kinase domain-containing protein n=1 Tax=Anisodus acutangulus TaxID=402998 RepID=A0A9Q1MJZ8_9SOLA|nr:hypothetical protein K7X08_011666 [Anisodus acutangulus]
MGSSRGKFSSNKNESVEEKEEILSIRTQQPNPRLGRGVPKGIEGEWPNWLAAVAGEALNGLLPRRADTFEKIDKIGQGTYSNVYKARDCLLNKVVALKKVRLDNLDPESVKFMAREIIILRRLGDHPNVIKLEGLVTSKMSCSLYLVFDCMEYDLKGIQEQKGAKFSEPEIKCYMHQLLKGLDHCHSRGILHRDVTTSNLLVNKEGVLKIADIGLSTFFDPEQSIPLTSRIVTLWYRPPELLLGSNSYGVEVDLWGVGCVLGELFTGKPIMPGRTEPTQPYRQNLQATFYDLPVAAVGLMDTLLSVEPEYRGTAALALQEDDSLPIRNPGISLKIQMNVSGGTLNEGTNSSASFEESSRKEGSENYTQSSAAPHQTDDQRSMWRKPVHVVYHSKGKKKWPSPLPTASDKMQDLLREHDSMIVKAVTCARLEKGIMAKVNDRDSKGKKNHSLGPSTSTSHETTGNDQISTPLPAKSTNMQGLPREHEARILKDAQWVMSDKEKTAEGAGWTGRARERRGFGPISQNSHSKAPWRPVLLRS